MRLKIWKGICMLKHIVRLKHLIEILVIFLSLTMSVEPLFAQLGNVRQFDRPLQNGAGSSFRQKDINESIEGNIDQDNMQMLGKGSMLSGQSMTGLTYQVHVLGEVNKPGTYRVMASERLAEVLQKAGGIADQGSKRRIEIRRDGSRIKTVDLLSFQLHGNLDHNPYLLDNDVIFVPLKSQSVQVVGAVKRPDTYELAGEKSIKSAINLAGGFSAGLAANEPIRVIRFVGGEKQVIEIPDVDSELIKESVQNGDVIYVPNVITAGHKFDYDLAKIPGDNVFYPSYEDRVFVLGGVGMPGAYPFNPYYNIHQYISLAGGYSKLSTKDVQVLTPEGKTVKWKKNKELKINPGDTLLVGERRIPPEGWVNLFMSIAGFGLSTTATVITLTR